MKYRGTSDSKSSKCTNDLTLGHSSFSLQFLTWGPSTLGKYTKEPPRVHEPPVGWYNAHYLRERYI